MQLSSVVAVSGLAAACTAIPASPAPPDSGAAVPSEGVTLNFAVGLAPNTESIMAGMLDQFKAEQGIEIQLAELPPYVGFFEKIMTQIAANTTPDAAQMIAYWTAVLGKADVLLKLDDLLAESPAERFDPTLLGSYCQWQGKTHALPLNTNVQGLLYNEDHFEKAGITAPTAAAEAWTWDEFSAVCQQVSEANDIEYAYGIYGGAPQGRLIQVYQNNSAIISTDLSQPGLDTPEAIEALVHIQSLFQNGYTAAEIWTASDPRFAGTEMFKSGRIAIFHGGQWHIEWAKENLPELPWGVTYLQQQAQLTTVPGGDSYVVFGNTKAPAESTALIEFMTNDANQLAWNGATYRIPSSKSLLEPGAITYPDHQEEMNLFIDHLKYGSQHMLLEYYADGWSKTDAMLRQRTSEIATGQMEAAAWAQEVADEIRGYIAEGGF
jgi:multiple sugar transport system substrate-binding protein